MHAHNEEDDVIVVIVHNRSFMPYVGLTKDPVQAPGPTWGETRL
jgi:hypothetical protein